MARDAAMVISASRSDGLCTRCWLPAVWILRSHRIDISGVSSAMNVWCDNCRKKIAEPAV